MTSSIVHTNKEKIKAIVLTDEEIELAIIEGKTKKYFHEKHKQYWHDSEFQQRKEKGTTSLQ